MTNRLLLFVSSIAVTTTMGCGYSSPTQPVTPPPAVPAGLWVGSGSPAAIVRFAQAQFADTGVREPATTITATTSGVSTPVAVAFDESGQLWIANADQSAVLALAPESLETSGDRSATTIIEAVGGSLSTPTGLAFDASHRLWVANYGNGTIVRYDAAQLAAGGAVAPSVVIAGAGHPRALAFDAAGKLWVADAVINRLFAYSPGQLAASGAPVPVVSLSAPENSAVANPSGLAFDAAGNLWVANLDTRTVVAFTPAQLAASAMGLPNITLSSQLESFRFPVGLAFAADGSLWVVGGSGTIAQIARENLGISGAPAATARVTVSGHAFLWNAAFWPKPAGLPLR